MDTHQFNQYVHSFTEDIMSMMFSEFEGKTLGEEGFTKDDVIKHLFRDNKQDGETIQISNKEYELPKQKIQELEKKSKHGDKKLLRVIVKEGTGHNVIKADPEIIEAVKKHAIKARDYQIDVNKNMFTNKDGIPRERYNECGNDMENVLKTSSDNVLKGLGKACGYPDLHCSNDEYYLECKVAAANSTKSSFRSFYLSTLDKITKSQPHILVCFKHHNGKLLKSDEPIVIDLYDLELSLKCEWQSNNKEMYSTF